MLTQAAAVQKSDREKQTSQASARCLFVATAMQKEYLEQYTLQSRLAILGPACLCSDAFVCVMLLLLLLLLLLSAFVCLHCFDSRAKESTSSSSSSLLSSLMVVAARSALFEINLNTFRTDYGNVSEQFICCSCSSISLLVASMVQ